MPYISWRYVALSHVACLLLLGAGLSADVPSEESGAVEAGHVVQPNDKAARYWRILAARPQRGYLFDRFRNAWLETATSEQLEQFLTSQSDELPQAALLLAFLYEAEAKDVRALAQYDVAMKRCAQRDENAPAAVGVPAAEVLYHRSRLQSMTLAYEPAIDGLEAALEHDPPQEMSLRIRKLLGTLYLRVGRRADGLKTWQAMVDAAGAERSDLQEELIDLQMQEGLFQQAIVSCRELIDQTDEAYKAVTLRLRLGQMYARCGQNDKALATHRETLKSVGTGSWLETETLARIERIFRAGDHLTGLAECYAGLRAAMPQRTVLARRHSRVLQELGRTDDAITVFRESLKLTPGNKQAREQFIRMLVRAERYESAAAAAETLAKQHPDDAEILLLLADLKHRLDRKDETVSLIDRYLESSDGSQYAHLRAARLLTNYGLNDRATDVYAAAVERFADSISVRQSQAQHLYATGRKDEALATYRAIADTGDKATLLRVARALARHKEHAEALTLLEAHADEYDDDVGYLRGLYEHAAALRKHAEALRYARKRVEAAARPLELEMAVNDAVAAARRSETRDALCTELAGIDERTVGQSCLLVSLLDDLHLRADADETLTGALAAHERSVLLWNMKYQLARRRLQWEVAATALKRMMALEPPRRSLYLQRLAQTAFSAGDVPQAVRHVDEWKKASPSATAPYMFEARVHSRNGDADAAVAVLRSAALKFPDNNELLYRLATANRSAGRYTEAARICWKLLERQEELTAKLALVRQLAELAEMRERTDRLIFHFETRLKNNPKSLLPPLALAEIYHHLNDYARRREYLLKAAEIRPDDVSLLRHLAKIEEREGDYEQAIATLQRAASRDKTTRSPQELARLYFLYGDIDKGERIFLQLSSGQQADPAVAESIAQTLVATNQWQRAADLLDKALATTPDNYRLTYLRAVCLEKAGDVDAALEAFLRALEIDRELPGHRAPASASPMAMWGSGVLPPAVLEIMEVSQAQSIAHMRGHHGMTSNVPLPHSLGNLKTLAVAHLGQLSQLLSDAEIEALSLRLLHKGVAYPELKLRFSHGEPDRTLVGDLRCQHPDDPVLATLALVTWEPALVETETVRSVRDTLRDHGYDQLAILSVLLARRSEASDDDLLGGAIEQLGALETPSPILFAGLGQAVRNQQLPEAQAAALSKALLKLYPKLPRRQASFMPVLRIVVPAVAAGGDAKDLVELLEMEAGHSSRRQSAMPFWYRGRANQSLVKPPAFPPTSLPGFSDAVLSFFKSREMVDTLSQADAAKHVDTVTHPVLKVLLAWRAGDGKVTAAQIDALLGSSEPNATNLLLAAGWHQSAGDAARAVALLDQTRHLAMNYALRRQLDGMIVGSGLLAPDNEDVKNTSRAAAMRLRRCRLGPDQGRELRTAMVALGMTAEAEKIASANPLRAAVRHSAASSSMVQADRIAELVADGKKDQAARLLAMGYRVTFQGLFAAGSPAWRHREALQTTCKMIRLHELDDELVARLAAGSPRDRLALGYLHEQLDRPAKARQTYRALLESHPEQKQAHLHLAMLTTGAEREEYLDAVDASPADARRWLPRLGMMLAWGVDECEAFETILDRAALAAEVLKRLRAHPHGGNAAWAQETMATLEHSMRGSWGANKAVHLNELFSPSGGEVNAELDRKRRDVYRRLCIEAAQTPHLKDWAFRRLVHLAVTDDTLDDRQSELLAVARKAVAACAPIRSGMTTHHYWSGTEIPYHTPERFLVADACRTGRTEALDAFVATLSPAAKRTSGKRISMLRPLYEAKDEQFIDAGKELMRRSAPGRMPTSEHTPLDTVIDAWTDTNRDVSLTPLIISEATRAVRQAAMTSYNADMPGFIAHWGRALRDRKGGEVAAVFVRTLGDTLRCEARENELSTAAKTCLAQTINELTSDPQTAAPILATATHYPELYARVKFQGYSRNPLEGDTLATRLANLADRPAFLEGAAVTAEADAFSAGCMHETRASVLALTAARIIDSGDTSDAMPWVKQLLTRAGDNMPAYRDVLVRAEGVAKATVSRPSATPQTQPTGTVAPHTQPAEALTGIAWLRARRPQTFGTGLLLTIVTETTPEAIYSYLGERLDAIEAMDESQQKDLCVAVHYLSERIAGGAPSGLTGPAGRYATFARKMLDTQLLETARRLQREDVEPWDDDDYARRVARVVGDLFVTHRDEAESLLTRAERKIVSLRQQYAHSRYDDEMPDGPRAELLRLVIEESPTSEAVPFVLKRLAKTKCRTLGLYMRLESLGKTRFVTERLHQQAHARQRADGFVSRGKIFLQTVDALDEQFDGMRVPGLAAAMQEALARYGPVELACLERLLTARKDASNLLREALATVRMVRSNHNFWRPWASKRDWAEEIAMPEEVMAFHRDGLKDDALSTTWRIGRILKPAWTGPQKQKVIEKRTRMARRFMRLEYGYEDAEYGHDVPVLNGPGTPRRRLWAPALALAAQNAKTLPPAALMQLVSIANRLEVDDAWRAAAKPMLTALRRSHATHGGHATYPRNDALAQWAALTLALKLGDLEAARALLSEHDGALATQRQTYAVLLKYGPRALFVETLGRHWQDIPPASSFDACMPLSAELRSKADDWLSAMAPGDLRLIAEALLASLPVDCTPGLQHGGEPPDAWGRPPVAFEASDALLTVCRLRRQQLTTQDWFKGEPTGQPRGAVVVAALADLPFSDEDARATCASWFDVPPHVWHMARVVAERAEGKRGGAASPSARAHGSFQAVAHGPEETGHDMRGIQLCLLIDQGKEDEALAAYRKAAKRADSEDDWDSRQACRELLTPLETYLSDASKLPVDFTWQRDPDQMLALGKKLVSDVVTTDDFIAAKTKWRIRGAVWALHYVTGRQDELDAWLETLPESVAKRLRKADWRYQPDVFELAMRSASAERRSELLQQFARLVSDAEAVEEPEWLEAVGPGCVASRPWMRGRPVLREQLEADLQATLASIDAGVADGSTSLETVCHVIAWRREERQHDKAGDLARRYLRAHPSDEVRRKLDKALRSGTKRALLALTLGEEVEQDEAMPYVAEAVQLFRECSPDTIKKSGTDTALEAARKVLTAPPSDEARRHAIELIGRLSEPEQVVATCDKHLAATDTRSGAVFQAEKARACLALGRVDEAVACMEKIATPAYRALRVAVCEKAGRYADAAEALLQAAEREDEDPAAGELLLKAAHNFQRDNNHARAIDVARQAAAKCGADGGPRPDGLHADTWLKARFVEAVSLALSDRPTPAKRLEAEIREQIKTVDEHRRPAPVRYAVLRAYLYRLLEIPDEADRVLRACFQVDDLAYDDKGMLSWALCELHEAALREDFAEAVAPPDDERAGDGP
ncbi:MAG: tetratricopeptide repeat protein [Phycisphaerae bacterium]|nr:tetratricopeptide repeat protein [Phycisphaerae bacterium]